MAKSESVNVETFREKAKAENMARSELEALFHTYSAKTGIYLSLFNHLGEAFIYEGAEPHNHLTHRFINKFSNNRAALLYFKNGLDEIEPGYEELFSLIPYINEEIHGERALIHMMYVPPKQRKQGAGKALFERFLQKLPKTVKLVRLTCGYLGSGDTRDYWKSLGFTEAYVTSDENTSRILHRAVNGHLLPPTVVVPDGEDRHYIFD